MRYKPSIAFDRMSGSAKGVTASQNKGAIFIRTRGTGSKKRTVDQATIKSIFRMLQQNWKHLTQAEIVAWNNAAKSQSGRRVLGQKAQLTGSNLYLRLNFWVVRCGGQPIGLPPVLTGIEQPAVAEAAISNGSFMFRLNSVPEQAAGLRLVIMATGPQTVGTVTGVGRGSTFCEPLVPTAGAVNLLQVYSAKFGMPNAGKPKVFLRYFYVNPTTGEKSGEQLINAYYDAGSPIMYNLNVIAPDDAQGSVTHAGISEHTEGSQVVVQAWARQNYAFLRWSDGVSLNPRGITMNRDYTIEPIFVFDQHFTVRGTVSPTGAGTVNGTGSYRPGQTVELEAEPNSGWRFDHWQDDEANTEAVRSVMVQGDVNLTAVFTRIQSSYECHLGVNNEDYGRVEPDTGYVTFDHGEECEIEAVPFQGYEFVRWSDGRTENPRTIVAVKQFELTAIFHSVRTEEFWLEERRCSIEGNGTELHYGDEIEVTVIPDNGFHFVGWSDDMANTNPVRRFVMTENFDWDIYPVCESDETYTLEVYADPEEGGTVTVSPMKEEYHMDERVDLVATPTEGWRFAGWHSRYWSDSGRETSVDIYRDMTIEARFVEIEPEGE